MSVNYRKYKYENMGVYYCFNTKEIVLFFFFSNISINYLKPSEYYQQNSLSEDAYHLIYGSKKISFSPRVNEITAIMIKDDLW